jgi:hypothetical protein
MLDILTIPSGMLDLKQNWDILCSVDLIVPVELVVAQQ